MEKLRARLKELKEREKVAKSVLSSIIKEINDIRMDIWLKDHNLSRGEDVIVGDKRGVLTDLNVVYSWVKPIITLYNKDGKLGKRTMVVYSDTSIKKA